MKDPEQAENLLAMAAKDFRALQGMHDQGIFSTEIFGFHVQQAVEKAMKAWLCFLGVHYPKIHDLDALAAMVQDAGGKIPVEFLPLIEYTDFAVTFRYDAFPELDAEIDRPNKTVLVGRFIEFVRALSLENEQ